MNPWELTGQIVGWVVFTLVALVAVAIVIVLVIGVGVIVVSVVQQLAAAVRARIGRAKNEHEGGEQS